MAYLLTFSTYGTHLRGSEKGWIDLRHSTPGSPVLAPDPELEDYWQARLKESPFILNQEQRLLTLKAILGVCTHRGWMAHAIHVRTTHAHAVVSGEVKPERMLSDFKAYSTRAFRLRFGEVLRRHYWTHHGSTRYLWNQENVNAAIDYVLNGQGARMAYYPADSDNSSA
jgi:hypothetical protein